MLFNTPDFLIFFVVVLVLVALFKFRKFQHILIVISSFYFIFYTDNFLVTLLISTILLHFYTGREIHKTQDPKKRKILFIIGVLGSLSLLGFFKYYDFAIVQFNVFGDLLNLENQIPLLNLALPIGISFYTFQSLSYIIDIYRGNIEPSKSLKEYAFFVSFFPALVAGPILRAKNFLPQLREKITQFNTNKNLKLLVINNSNLKFGLTLISLGLFKKLFFADNIGVLVDNIFVNPIGLESFSIILGAVAFGIQIYCDFSGYSDIAIGAAAILGFKIPLNFNKPFFATSPSDFWSRWHISLSTWVRDYLYYPLVLKNRKSGVVIFISLLISMFLMGLWHGASWNFVIWGCLHGIFLASYTILRKKFPNASSNIFFKTKFGKITSILITQYIVFFTFIVFRVKDFDYMFYSMEKYIFLDFQTVHTIEIIKSNEFSILLIFLFLILHFISYKNGNIVKSISKLKLKYWFVFLLSVFLPLTLFYLGSSEEFIYFQF
jgi:D-alanyl-lipoteichoic acid acyltransferase DltB (MBOAT superfamily)